MTPKLISLTVVHMRLGAAALDKAPILLGLDADGTLWQPRVAELGGPTPRINWQRVTQTFEEPTR